MEINYGDIKNNFDSNLKIIRELYRESTNNNKKTYHFAVDDVSEQIYNALKMKYISCDFLLPIVEKYFDNMNGLIRDLELSEHPINNEWDFIEFQDYEDNKEAFNNYETKHGKKFYFIPHLHLYITRLEERKKTSIMILKMSYVYLHNILDEFTLDTIKLVSYLFLESLGKKKQLTYEEIFSCKRIDDVYKKMVDKEINTLSHGSIEDKIKFLEDRGISLGSVDKDELILFGEIRNSITHTKGVINEEIIKKIESTSKKGIFEVGKSFQFSEDDLNNWFEKIKMFSNELYEIVLDKFKDKFI